MKTISAVSPPHHLYYRPLVDLLFLQASLVLNPEAYQEQKMKLTLIASGEYMMSN